MRNFSTFCLLSLLISVSFTSCQNYSDTHLQNAVDDLKQFFKNQQQISKGFDRIFFDVYVIFTLNPKSKIFTEEECEVLQETDTASLDVKDLYYYMRLQNLQNQCKLQTPDSVAEQFQALKLDDAFSNFYYANNGILLLNAKENIEDSCQKLLDFVLPDGTGQIHAQRPDSNYLYGGILLELASHCQGAYPEKVSQLVDDAKAGVENALATLIQFFPNQLGWLEFSYTIESVAQMVHGIELFLPQSDALYQQYRSSYFYGLINYLREQNSQILTPKQRFFLIETFQVLENEAIFTLQKGSVVTSKTNTEVLFRYENIFGEQIVNVNQNLTAVLLFDDNVVFKISNFQINQKSEEWNFLFDIPTKEIQNFGYYTLRVSSNAPIEAIIENKVLITTRVKVPEIEFEIIEEKGSIPISFENKVKSGERLEKLLPATEHSQIHFRFKLEFDRSKSFLPNLVGIQLKHPVYRTTNNIAFAKYDESQDSYRVLLDLGDTDVTLAYADKYEIELIIADPRLKENVRWSFAQLDVTFSKVRKEAPPNDADFVTPSIIQHSFPAPRPDVPTHFVLFFCILIGAALLFFIQSLASIGVNFGQMPSSADGKLFVFLFFAAIIVLLLLLVVFWVYINLVKTMYILLFITIPIFLIGNKALSAIKLEAKNN